MCYRHAYYGHVFLHRSRFAVQKCPKMFNIRYNPRVLHRFSQGIINKRGGSEPPVPYDIHTLIQWAVLWIRTRVFWTDPFPLFLFLQNLSKIPTRFFKLLNLFGSDKRFKVFFHIKIRIQVISNQIRKSGRSHDPHNFACRIRIP